MHMYFLFLHFEKMHFSISFHGKKFARKAVPGSLGVALDLADKASGRRPEELVQKEDFPDGIFSMVVAGIWESCT